MAEWYECVCQFLRNQSQVLSGVLQGIGNQNTISDIDTTGSDSISEHLNSDGAPNMLESVTPMHVFMVCLAVVWTYMFIFGQMNKETQKPANRNIGGNEDDHKENHQGGGVA